MLIVNIVEDKHKTPEFIIVKNVAKYKLYKNPKTLSEFGVPKNDCKNTMTFDEMQLLNPKINSTYFDDYNIKECITSIENCFKDNNVDDQIINEILEHTYFERYFEEWDITDICRKYNISGRDVFIKLCIYNPDVEEDSEDEENDKDNHDGYAYSSRATNTSRTLGRRFDNAIKHNTSRYKQENGAVYFDYINGGVGVKNKFPINVYKSRFSLQMRRFNSRNNYCGYYRLLRFFINKITQGITHEFTSILDQFKELDMLYTTGCESMERNNDCRTKMCISYNNRLINDMGTIDKYKNAWNWRNRYYFETNKAAYEQIDPNVYDLEATYNTYFKDAGLKLDLAYYFNLKEMSTVVNNVITKTYVYGNNNFTCELKNVSIINILLFSKSRVNYESLNNLLEYVRIKQLDEYCSNGAQIDNYIVKHRLTSNPKYSSVEFMKYDEYDTEFKFAKSLRDKTTVARYFITIAQEYPPDTLNMHNFCMMLLFKENNESFSEAIYSSVLSENTRLDYIRKV